MTAPNKPTNDSASTSIEDSALRDQLRALKRPTMQDFRYPIEAYEDDLVALINRIRQADRQELIARVEALIGKDIDRAEFDSGGDVNEEWKYSDDYTVNAYDFIRGYNIRAKEIRAALTQLKGEKDS